MHIGFCTATFDVLHEGHVAFIQACRALLPANSTFIIGLTTDELAVRQKRKPMFPYAQRRAVLMAIRGVDQVVPNHGEPKEEMRQRLHYTDLFTGAEYRGTEEYRVMERLCRVFYINCPTNRAHSSSQIAERLALESVDRLRMVCDGTAGSVFLYDDKPLALIYKTVRISQLEWEGKRNANVYSLPVPHPRNLKRKGAVHRYPMLPGVNSYREVDVQALVRPFAWCSTVDVKRIYERAEGAPIASFRPDYSHIRLDKANAKEVWAVVQRYEGPTLTQFIRQHEADEDDAWLAVICSIIEQVRTICTDDLQRLRLVHGDIHSDNICLRRVVAKNQPVGATVEAAHYEAVLIDFGWCLHHSFPMDASEQAYYEECLANGWDWTHFTHSLVYSFDGAPWLDRLLSADGGEVAK